MQGLTVLVVLQEVFVQSNFALVEETIGENVIEELAQFRSVYQQLLLRDRPLTVRVDDLEVGGIERQSVLKPRDYMELVKAAKGLKRFRCSLIGILARQLS